MSHPADYAQPAGAAPAQQPATQVVYVAAPPPVVAPQQPPSKAQGSTCAAITGGILALVSCILLGLGAGGPWWQAWRDGDSYIWFALPAVRLCWPAGAIQIGGFTSITAWSGGCAVYNAYIDYAAYVNAFVALGGNVSTFNQSIFNLMQAGAGLLAFSCALAFVAMCVSFAASCAGSGGNSCLVGTQAVLHWLTFAFALCGTVVGGAAVYQAGWANNLTYGSWMPGFGAGCAIAGVVIMFFTSIVVTLPACCGGKRQ